MLEPGTPTTPFFSVIINCHNSELYLKDAIESVLSQTFKDYELIVFDNASTDTTAQIAKSYGSSVCYYLNEKKLSLGAARNQAVMKAKGDYIAFLDSDDIWISSKLESQNYAITQRDSFDEIGLCGSDALRVSADLTPLAKYSLGRIRVKGSALVSLMHDCFIPMSSTVVNRKICLALGGFNESFDIIEEWDLWIRIAQQFQVIYLPECLVKIRFHSSNTSKDYVVQDKEITKMLAAIDASASIDKKTIDSVKATWLVRYIIVDLFNSSHKGLRHKAKLTCQLIILILKRPKASFTVLRSYFSVQLFRFALIKYVKA